MKKLLLLFFLPFLSFAQDDVAFAKAETYYKNAEYKKAAPLFRAFLTAHADDTRTIEYLGDIAGYAKDWDTAIDYYEKLVELQPKVANAHYKYGGVMGMKALEVNKLRALGMIGDIKESFLTAARLDQKHLEVRWALVEFYIQLPGIVGGSEKKAIKYANELAALSPVDGFLSKGYIAEYSDRPNDAERYYKEAVKVGGSVNCYTKLYEHYEKNDQPDKAIATLSEAQERHTSNNRLHYQLGKIAGQYGIGLDQGIACLNRYIEHYSPADGVPKDWAYLRLAQIYRHQNKKDKALMWIHRALENRKDFKEALTEKKQIQAL